MKSSKPTSGRILPNGVEIPREDDYIWRAYNDSCVIHPYRLAVCLHEEPPKSINPNWQDEPWKRYALCRECHDMIHDMPRDQAVWVLATSAGDNFPNSYDDILVEFNRQEGI